MAKRRRGVVSTLDLGPGAGFTSPGVVTGVNIKDRNQPGLAGFRATPEGEEDLEIPEPEKQGRASTIIGGRRRKKDLDEEAQGTLLQRVLSGR